MTTGQIASTIVTLVEKHLGTGFDPVTDAVLIGAVAEYLEEEVLGAHVTASRNLPTVALDLDAAIVRSN
jgi:hypothetical protein